MRVLIVEDDAIVAMHLAMLLTELGHETCGTATSAATAIAQAAKYQPDIVLMDIRLAQGSSGIEAARELHARQSLRRIFLSANLDEPTKRALLPYQPIDFVGKPVLPILLERALEKAQQMLMIRNDCGVVFAQVANAASRWACEDQVGNANRWRAQPLWIP